MTLRRLWRGFLVAAFALCIVYITLFTRTVSLSRELGTNLFESWRAFIAGDKTIGQGILLNIGMFIPFGYLTAAFYAAFDVEDEESDRKSSKLGMAVLVILTGTLFSLVVEVLQYRTGRGMFEVDDLFNNSLGAAIGLVMYMVISLLVKEQKAGRVLAYGLLPALMLAAGLAGGWKMSRMVLMTNNHADQFWFSVELVEGDSFSGHCYLYDGKTPNYQLFLKSGKKSQKTQLVRDGEKFTATAPREDGKQYEIQVQFHGFPKMSTGVYLNGTNTEYVEGTVQLPADLSNEPQLANADLKACSVDWDCYVFESGRELIFLVGSVVPESTEVICHLHTNEPERLPEQRVEHGFDNLGFLPEVPDKMVGSYRCFVKPIPTSYPVSQIIVGLNPGTETGEIVWNSSFRP